MLSQVSSPSPSEPAAATMEFHGHGQSKTSATTMEQPSPSTTIPTPTPTPTSVRDSSIHAVFHHSHQRGGDNNNNNNSFSGGGKNDSRHNRSTTTTTATTGNKPDILLFSPSPVSSKPKVVVPGGMKGGHTTAAAATTVGGKINVNPCFVSPLLMSSATTPMNPGAGRNCGVLNRTNFSSKIFHNNQLGQDDHSSISAITIDSQLLLSSQPNLDTAAIIANNINGNDSLSSHTSGLLASSNHTKGSSPIYTMGLNSLSPPPAPGRGPTAVAAREDDVDDEYSHEPLRGGSNHTSSVSDCNSLAKMYRRATNQRRRSRSDGRRRRRRGRGEEIQPMGDEEQEQFDRFASNTSYQNDTIPSLTFRSRSVRSLDVSEDGTAMANDVDDATTKEAADGGGSTPRLSKGECLDFSKHSMHSMASIKENKVLSDEGTNVSYNGDDSDVESDVGGDRIRDGDDGPDEEEYYDGDGDDDEFGGEYGDFEDYVEDLQDFTSPRPDGMEYTSLKSPQGTNRFRLDVAVPSPVADSPSTGKIPHPLPFRSTGAVASAGAALMIAISESKKSSSSKKKKDSLSSTSHANRSSLALPPKMPVRCLSNPSLS